MIHRGEQRTTIVERETYFQTWPLLRLEPTVPVYPFQLNSNTFITVRRIKTARLRSVFTPVRLAQHNR